MKRTAATKALMQFAFEECANHVHRGTCEIRDRKPCRMGQGTRCPYFETSVFPIATRGLRLLRLPAKAARDDRRVVEAFRMLWPTPTGKMHAGLTAPRRTCPDCGGPLPPRKRVCAQCRQVRRRASYRKAKESARNPCVTSTVKPEKGAKSPGFSGCFQAENPPKVSSALDAPDGPLTVDTAKGTSDEL